MPHVLPWDPQSGGSGLERELWSPSIPLRVSDVAKFVISQRVGGTLNASVTRPTLPLHWKKKSISASILVVYLGLKSYFYYLFFLLKSDKKMGCGETTFWCNQFNLPIELDNFIFVVKCNLK